MTANKHRRYFVNYRPATHEGRRNTQESTYLYDVDIVDFLQNWSNGECFAGFRGKTQDGFRSFRWDRVVSIVAQ
tara:strand:- start:130 stop:351 length:222 start_codon:yes stop_codon:yes gene_type:complete